MSITTNTRRRNDVVVDHLMQARKNGLRAAAAKEKEDKRKAFESMLVIQAALIIDERLTEGTVAHEVATALLGKFPDAVKTPKFSRTMAAKAAVIEELPNERRYTEGAVRLGLRVADEAIRKAYDMLDKSKA